MYDPYDFRPLTHSDEELAETSALLLRVFPRARHLTPGYLAWLYRDNPDGRALGYNAWYGDRLVGHCGGVRLTANVEGRLQRGILLVNAAVEAEHRRRNITRRTTDPMFEEAAASGYGFAISTGNRYSTRPLLTRFKMVGRLDARVGFGFPEQSEAGPPASFERVWTEAAFRWRLANPSGRYSVTTRDGGCTIIARTPTKGLGAILYQGDNRWDVGETDERPPIGRLWLGLDPSLSWRKPPFVSIPARLRPSPLNLLFKNLSDDSVPQPERIVFRAIDFDAY
jgi:hypothetical protein